MQDKPDIPAWKDAGGSGSCAFAEQWLHLLCWHGDTSIAMQLQLQLQHSMCKRLCTMRSTYCAMQRFQAYAECRTGPPRFKRSGSWYQQQAKCLTQNLAVCPLAGVPGRLCGKSGAARRRGLPLGAGQPSAHSIPAPQPVAGSPLLSTIVTLPKTSFLGVTQPSGVRLNLHAEEQVASVPGCLGLGQRQGKQSWTRPSWDRLEVLAASSVVDAAGSRACCNRRLRALRLGAYYDRLCF